MEITPDQKRVICTMLVEQTGHCVSNPELMALCNDETITEALQFITRLIEIKYCEITASLAADVAEPQLENPQMAMEDRLSDSTHFALNKETTTADLAQCEILTDADTEATTETAVEKQKPLKNNRWLFEDLDTDDSEIPAIGELPVCKSQTTLLNNHPPLAEQQDNSLLAVNWMFADDTDPVDPAGSMIASHSRDTQAPAQPTIKIDIACAHQNEQFNSPVTAMLHDGRLVTILGIYFQSSIGLNFNESTSTLYGKPTESGEFLLQVVWELAPKHRFSTDVTFVVTPDLHDPHPLPEIHTSPAE